jgi:hypothetical protein
MALFPAPDSDLPLPFTANLRLRIAICTNGVRIVVQSNISSCLALSLIGSVVLCASVSATSSSFNCSFTRRKRRFRSAACWREYFSAAPRRVTNGACGQP